MPSSSPGQPHFVLCSPLHQGRLLTLLDDSSLHLWEIIHHNGCAHLEEGLSFQPPSRPSFDNARYWRTGLGLATGQGYWRGPVSLLCRGRAETVRLWFRVGCVEPCLGRALLGWQPRPLKLGLEVWLAESEASRQDLCFLMWEPLVWGSQ